MGVGAIGAVPRAWTRRTPRRCRPRVHAVRAPVRRTRVVTQYQEELPVQRPTVRRFDIAGRPLHATVTGGCRAVIRCKPRTRSARPRCSLGPQAVAFAVILNKRFGLPYGKIAALFRDRFGLTVTRGGLVHAVRRAARHAQPSYARPVRHRARESRGDVG